MNAEKLGITLPADMARLTRGQVEAGAYASNSEVIRDAMRLWQERLADRERRLGTVRAKIQEVGGDPKRITDDELGRHFGQRLAKARKQRRS